MSNKYTVDVVIGTKSCLKCGHPVSVESYSIPEAKERLESHLVCHNVRDGIECVYDLFTDPKFEIKMKPYKDWLNPLLNMLRK